MFILVCKLYIHLNQLITTLYIVQLSALLLSLWNPCIQINQVLLSALQGPWPITDPTRDEERKMYRALHLWKVVRCTSRYFKPFQDFLKWWHEMDWNWNGTTRQMHVQKWLCKVTMIFRRSKMNTKSETWHQSGGWFKGKGFRRSFVWRVLYWPWTPWYRHNMTLRCMTWVISMQAWLWRAT